MRLSLETKLHQPLPNGDRGEIGVIRADFSSSIENEWLCTKIISEFGLPVCDSEIAQFEDQKALIVTRFDRKLSIDKKRIFRIPQEDMCQAYGQTSFKKYESEGGPGILQIMDLLRASKESDGQKTLKAKGWVFINSFFVGFS